MTPSSALVQKDDYKCDYSVEKVSINIKLNFYLISYHSYSDYSMFLKCKSRLY